MNFRNILEHAHKERTLVSLYGFDSGQTEFTVGTVESLLEDGVVLKVVTPFGEPSGYEMFRYEDIAQVSHGGQYERRVQALSEGQSRGAVFGAQEVAFAGGTVMDCLAALAGQRTLVIVWIRDGGEKNSFPGFVAKVQDGDVALELVDNYGRADGTAVLDASLIVGIDIDSRECQVLRFLHEQGTEIS